MKGIPVSYFRNRKTDAGRATGEEVSKTNPREEGRRRWKTQVSYSFAACERREEVNIYKK